MNFLTSKLSNSRNRAGLQERVDFFTSIFAYFPHITIFSYAEQKHFSFKIAFTKAPKNDAHWICCIGFPAIHG